MPVIRVDMYSGRTIEQKRELARRLTETYISVVGGEPRGVTILFNDVSKVDWSVGGELSCDRESTKPPATEGS
jgi:4-oxalocrotonate tautomerase